MNEENTRIKEVRKALSLTMEKFGEKVGMKRNSLSQVENGVNSVSNQLRSAVCREFNVNETWLRTGEGTMFLPQSDNDLLKRFAESLTKINDDDFKKRIVTAMAKMDDEQWESFKKAMEALFIGFHCEEQKK